MSFSPPESSHPASPTDLASPAIQVWHAPASVDRPGPIETFCESVLQPDEHESADRFQVPSARHQHVVGRGMARVLLAGEQCSPQAIQFAALDHGKPIVADPEAACRSFNIAHTRGLVICGLGAGDQWIGVDVEWTERKTDPALANRYFAPEEVRQLEAVGTEGERQALFLKIWTLKESFIKAIGTGLYTPLDQFAFDDVHSDQPTLSFHNPDLARNRHWRFRSFSPKPGFVAATAVGLPTEQPSPEVELADFESWLAQRVF